MDLLSSGFCGFAQASMHPFSVAAPLSSAVSSLANAAPTAPERLWLEPSLQVVDVQSQRFQDAFPNDAGPLDSNNKESVMYLALSDGETLMWSIAPPQTAVDRMVRDDLELGNIIILHDYDTLRAQNGLHVLVLLDISCRGRMAHSLIGSPSVPSDSFNLSPTSLIAKSLMDGAQTPDRRRSRGSESRHDTLEEVTFQQLWLHAEGSGESPAAKGCGKITVRVLWKSKLRRAAAAAPAPRGAADGDKEKYVFDVKAVDREGTGANLLFWGSRKRHSDLVVGSVYSITRGIVRVVDGVVKSVDFNDRSTVAPVLVVDADETEGNPSEIRFPSLIVHDLCPLSDAFDDDLQRVLSRDVGTVVSFRGIVAKASAVATVHTRSGRVDRRNVVVVSCEAAHRAAASSSLVMNVTLWGDAAHVEINPKETYCFRNFKISVFSTERGATSKSASEIIPFATLAVLTTGTTSSPRVVPDRPEASLSPAPFSDSLFAASGGEPVVARVSNIEFPIHFVACTTCGRRAATISHCTHCGVSSTEPRYALRLSLSDGVNTLSAVALSGVAEILFGFTAEQYVRALAEDPSGLPDHIMRNVIGAPLVVRLLRTPDHHGWHLFDVTIPEFATLSRAFLSHLHRKLVLSDP